MQKLSDAIKEFGKRLEEDADYSKCKGEYDVARSALVQVFKSLEGAYLAASKNDALYDSAEKPVRGRERRLKNVLVWQSKRKKEFLKANNH